MSCIIGNTYSFDGLIESFKCTSGSSLVAIRSPNSGQILTLESGANAWTSNTEINNIIPASGLNWILENGSNLYSYAFGLLPISISGSGLPSGLSLSSFNTITGIPTETGIFKCNLKYIYSGTSCANLYTGVNKNITINVCKPSLETITYNKIFYNNLGPKFNFDPLVEYSNGCFSGVSLITIPSGQKLTLESGANAWTYNYNIDYTFITGNRIFTLKTGTNLFNTTTGIQPTFISGNLPAGLGFKDYYTITGIPEVTGQWTCAIKYGYCVTNNNPYDPDMIFGITKNIIIEVLDPTKIDYSYGKVYMGFSTLNTLSYNLVKVKNINFYYDEDNRFIKYFDNITGYGDNIIKTITISNPQLSFGQIERPTGFLPAVMYQTGILSGNIEDQSSSYSWTNVLITGTGNPGVVYIDNIIGTSPAINIINFNTGLLLDGDNLNINGVDFYYKDQPTSNYEFNSLDGLINVFNSGATGGLDYNLQQFVGITGYLNGSNMFLYSYTLSGEDGNSIKITRNTQNLDSIKIPYRYFQSGQTFRDSTTRWTGIFSTTYSIITKEKSGIYLYNYVDNSYFGNITGTVWEDTFSGNYYITTGILDITKSLDFSGDLVPFISNIYFGSGTIPSGQNSVPTGFSISIRKPNYYNISGNIAKYIVSGEDFLYSGLIKG